MHIHTDADKPAMSSHRQRAVACTVDDALCAFLTALHVGRGTEELCFNRCLKLYKVEKNNYLMKKKRSTVMETHKLYICNKIIKQCNCVYFLRQHVLESQRAVLPEVGNAAADSA